VCGLPSLRFSWLQVKRARGHNQKAGLATQCTVVQGNFLALPFPEATFDAAYAPLTLRCHTHHRGCAPALRAACVRFHTPRLSSLADAPACASSSSPSQLLH
jgi:hypothetical protein